MQQLSSEERTRIIAGLQHAGVTQPCPRCSNSNFTLLDGLFPVGLQKDLTGLVIGGPTVPAVAVACDRCGFLAFHALGALRPLPSEKAN